MTENPTSVLPTDAYSMTRRQLTDNPGAAAAQSTIHTADWYGHSQTWTVETYRVDGEDTVLLQRIDASGGLRLVLPPPVTKAIAAQRDRVSGQVRRRAGHALIARRRERGDVLGNPEALRKARERRKRAQS
jgi:hypothetical protein